MLHQSKSTRPFPPGHDQLDARVVQEGKDPSLEQKGTTLEMQEEHLELMLAGSSDDYDDAVDVISPFPHVLASR